MTLTDWDYTGWIGLKLDWNWTEMSAVDWTGADWRGLGWTGLDRTQVRIGLDQGLY